MSAWYKRWWGIIVIAAIILILVWAGTVLFFVYRFRQGEIGNFGMTASRSVPRIGSGSVPRTLFSDDDPVLGNPAAAIRIVEFGDFQCPFSRKEFPIVRELMARYAADVAFQWRDFPIADVHPDAMNASMAGECADEQGKFWAYHDRLFQNQEDLSVGALKRYARATGLQEEAFDRCLDSGRFRDEVLQDWSDGVAAGVPGTPTFFVNGQQVAGAIPLDIWEKIFAKFSETLQ